jgi:hypothetical protein
MNDAGLRPLPPEPLPSSRHGTNVASLKPNIEVQPAVTTSAVSGARPIVPAEIVHPITELKVYSHSPLVYWWPMWIIGFLMAGLSHWQGQQIQIGADLEWFHLSSNLGICFFAALIVIILITNVSVRGFASGMVILAAAFVTVLFAYLGLWDQIVKWLGGLKIHLNQGAYFWFSTLLLVIWTLSVFVFDRMSYWHFKPGQVTHEFGFGAGSKSYDTNGMLLEKHREDLFRHWLLGVGSGDLKISTTGAIKEQIDVPNVLFIGSKIAIMQRLIAEEPDA